MVCPTCVQFRRPSIVCFIAWAFIEVPDYTRARNPHGGIVGL